MPEHVRALIIILVLASVVFFLARRPAQELIDRSDFARRRNLWLVLTLVAFLTGSFWIYAAFAIVILSWTGGREQNPVALYFVLLFLIPVAEARIPGFGVINYLFDMTQVRLLGLFVLLPVALVIRRQSDSLPFGRAVPDKALAAYLVVALAVAYRAVPSFTTILRVGLELFLDVFLPYYVASRALRNVHDFRGALFSLVLAAMILSLIAVFEAIKHWRLYDALVPAMGLTSSYSVYLDRAGLLRATATAGQPIALGYIVAVGIGFYLFLKDDVRSRLHRWLGGLLLTAGLVVPWSRGPWLGAAVMLVTHLATGLHPVRRLAKLAVAGAVAVPMMLALPGGEKILDMLPFFGSVDKGTIEYRERLIDNALIVIAENPWFGSPDYLKTEQMEEMRQGEGIIDIVNTYFGIALNMGIVGLALFLFFFVAVLGKVYRAMRLLPNKELVEYRLGQALLATLVGIMVTIATVSSITFIPVVYWSVAGLGVAYAYGVGLHRQLTVGTSLKAAE